MKMKKKARMSQKGKIVQAETLWCPREYFSKQDPFVSDHSSFIPREDL